MYFVLKKLESFELTISLSSFLFLSVSLVATNERIENDRSASTTDNVPSALSFLPVNGKTSGPR